MLLPSPCALLTLLVAGLLIFLAVPGTLAAPQARAWGALADEARRRPENASTVKSVVDNARRITTTPVVRRVYHYADLGKERTWLDGRAKFMAGQPRQEWFGLAMSDFSTAGTILSELPLLAFAYRATGEESFRTRLLAQLEETATWSPLQRPGWQLCTPAPDPVPADYWDGSWLATGQGIRALTRTLELMPPGSIPPDLLEKIRSLLRAEIKTIAEDWQRHRGWFRAGNGYPQTNQWVLPTEGLIEACLALGKEQFATEYELGVTNLIRALDVQGQHGEFNEGIGYAMFTVGAMLAAAHDMAVHGDPRGLEHPFLRNFPLWAVHHLQPGRYRVNCFDAGGAKTSRGDSGARGLYGELAVFTANPVAVWTLQTAYDGPADDLTGLLARGVTTPPEAPPLFALYDGPARRVNWRDSWEDNANGVWLRGGHPLDSHDHWDRGHVNYIARGQPILIEAGTPGYDNPSMPRLYSSVVGHNVLDVDGLTAKKAPAPLTVRRLDATGGEVTVEPTACYPGLAAWKRQAVWDSAHLAVSDEVRGEPGKPAAMTFRWHLGTQEAPVLEGGPERWTVRWADAEMVLESAAALQVTVEQLPDSTVCLGKKDNGWDYLHQCVVVRTAGPVEAWMLKTTVTPR